MQVWLFIGVLIAGLWISLSYVHSQIWGGSVNYLASGLILFLLVNSLICLWELVLFYHRRFIAQVYEKRRNSSKKKRDDPLILFKDVNVTNVFDGKLWAYIWIDYADHDPSYADSKSFGWAIDIGNGHSTLPAGLFLLGEILGYWGGNRFVDIVGFCMYWQCMYGTIIYFTSYLVNQRYKNSTGLEVFLFVVIPNSFWIVFPLLGLYSHYIGAQSRH
jgi:hypothetical protein